MHFWYCSITWPKYKSAINGIGLGEKLGKLWDNQCDHWSVSAMFTMVSGNELHSFVVKIKPVSFPVGVVLTKFSFCDRS